MSVEEKKDNNSKYLKDEEFNKELKQQVDSVLNIFGDYNKRRKGKETR